MYFWIYYPRGTIFHFVICTIMMLENFYQTILPEAGCDEAGRGCYAGPVFAAAVILPKDFFHPLLDDSKKVTPVNRCLLRTFIEQNAIAYAVASVGNEEIDQINILRASFKAMHLAIARLGQRPEFLLVDGNRFTPYPDIPHVCLVKGDGRYASIAAASILAKTYRDQYMEEMDARYPQYHWRENKGYGTAVHRQAIADYGLCPLHRKSFNIVPSQVHLF